MKNLHHNLREDSLLDKLWLNLWSNLWGQDIPWNNALTEDGTRGILLSLRRSLE